MNYMNTLVWIGFSQALFAGILMFTKSARTIADKILTGWLVLLSIEFLTCGFDYILFGKPLLSSSFLLFNPALYLYIRSLTESGFRLKYSQIIHLLPFLIFEILAYIIQQPLSLGDYLINNNNYLFRIAFALVNILSILIYNPLSILSVHKFRMHLQNESSNIGTNENIGWILSVSIFYIAFSLSDIILSFIVIQFKLNTLIPHIFNYSCLLALIYMLSFYGLRQRKLPDNLLIPAGKKTYKNPLLDEEKRMEIGQKVLDYLNKKRAYLNPGLNMEIMSADLNIPKHYLTEVLNAGLGKSFFRLVNSYRVEAVKQMLSDPGNKYSIEAIGYECGFSNKSSFYKIFKDIVGKTPSGYKSDLK